MGIRTENKKRGAFSLFDAAFVTILAVAMAVLMCSCSAADTQSASSSASSSAAVSASSAATAEENTVTVTVTSPEDADVVIDYTQEMTVAAGATVLDALEGTDLEVTVTDGAYGAFVEAIGGIANEGTSGWTYTVNGDKLQVSAGKATVNDGDVIAWSYVDMAE